MGIGFFRPVAETINRYKTLLKSGKSAVACCSIFGNALAQLGTRLQKDW